MVTTTSPAPDAGPQLLNGEALIGLTAAGKLFPGYRGESPLNPSTLFRWITSGARATSGVRVKLEAVRLGNRWVTSVEAINRFASSLTTASLPADDVAPPRSPASRRRGAVAAGVELDALGVRK
ncbi:DUF1580 domain-containing protein [Gemmata sp.]|uniref:DUF1580 domain-containing protein n=1 Tax=Gemmata sp. TaxID=1914242 RepID=UPI003F70A386